MMLYGIGLVLAVLLLAAGWLLKREIYKLGQADQKVENANDVVKAVKQEADRLVERRTDAEVLDSMRAKAAAKRKREAESKRRPS